MKAPSGKYPIEHRVGEIERLRMQAEAYAFDAEVMLDRIGVQADWHCIDLGCGAGGITDLMSSRVGSEGRVLGLDANPAMVEAARTWAKARGLKGVEYLQGDAYETGLPREEFQLVHFRFLAFTAGQEKKLLKEALALTKPGGVLAIQEPGSLTLNCYPPHPSWDRLRKALEDVFTAINCDLNLAQRLYGLLHREGLEDIQYRPFLVGFTSRDAMADYLPQTIESLKKALLEHQLISEREMEEALAACRNHLAQPDTISSSALVTQAWGRKPP